MRPNIKQIGHPKQQEPVSKPQIPVEGIPRPTSKTSEAAKAKARGGAGVVDLDSTSGGTPAQIVGEQTPAVVRAVKAAIAQLDALLGEKSGESRQEISDFFDTLSEDPSVFREVALARPRVANEFACEKNFSKELLKEMAFTDPEAVFQEWEFPVEKLGREVMHELSLLAPGPALATVLNYDGFYRVDVERTLPEVVKLAPADVLERIAKAPWQGQDGILAHYPERTKGWKVIQSAWALRSGQQVDAFAQHRGEDGIINIHSLVAASLGREKAEMLRERLSEYFYEFGSDWDVQDDLEMVSELPSKNANRILKSTLDPNNLKAIKALLPKEERFSLVIRSEDC